MTQSSFSWNSQENMHMMMITNEDQLLAAVIESSSTLFMSTPLTTTEDETAAVAKCCYSTPCIAKRSTIRTNPWLLFNMPTTTNNNLPQPITTLTTTTMSESTFSTNHFAFSSKSQHSLDISLCSSGYCSQDNSPESSIYSPDLLNSTSIDIDDKTTLEVDINGNEHESHLQYSSSIDHRRNIKSSPPTFHAPPPPPLIDESDEYLQELDTQMQSLTQLSDQIRQLIENAHEKRRQQMRSRQQCIDQMNTIRSLRWMVCNNFELIL